MAKESRPATPGQVRLLFGLSSLMVLPMVAFVMVYFVGQEAAAQDAVWLAFALALVAGACEGMILVRVVPLFGGSLPRRPSVRTLLASSFLVALVVVEGVGRLVHQSLPITMGVIAGTDAVLAIVLLIPSLRRLSEARAPRL